MAQATTSRTPLKSFHTKTTMARRTDRPLGLPTLHATRPALSPYARLPRPHRKKRSRRTMLESGLEGDAGVQRVFRPLETDVRVVLPLAHGGILRHSHRRRESTDMGLRFNNNNSQDLHRSNTSRVCHQGQLLRPSLRRTHLIRRYHHMPGQSRCLGWQTPLRSGRARGRQVKKRQCSRLARTRTMWIPTRTLRARVL